MAIGRYKDLCIDATDPVRLGTFWGRLLDREIEVLGDGDAVLRGTTPGRTIWINRVPEPKTVKHRVHLDVHASSIEAAIELGATVVDAESFPWAVLADPEGGEFCLFPRAVVPDERLYEVIVDSTDAIATATWWHRILGGELETEGEAAALTDIPDAPFEYLVFGPVPEPKVVKNRVHLDIVCPDVSLLTAAGASLRRAGDDGHRWDVLADPEGNEFCRFDPS